MLASLEIWDFLWILILVMAFAGGSAAYYKFKPSDRLRLRRLEDKVDLLLKNFNLEYQPSTPSGLSAEVMALADDPETRLRAIQLYQEQTGAGFTEARVTIEDYIAGRG
ncbi:MAG TPA: hypothetical protein VFB65_10065 [Pyrinomonadaceae bacterium]|nr:hypothetical protein [Pyrinomonadaceae bacterium]